MANLQLIEAIADQMDAEGWQECDVNDRCAEAARRYADVVNGHMPPPWAEPRPRTAHTLLRADGQYEMVFGE